MTFLAEDKKQAISKAIFEASHLKSQRAVKEEDICNYKENDVNFYSVCLLLLGDYDDFNKGLLHHPRQKEVSSSILFLEQPEV